MYFKSSKGASKTLAANYAHYLYKIVHSSRLANVFQIFTKGNTKPGSKLPYDITDLHQHIICKHTPNHLDLYKIMTPLQHGLYNDSHVTSNYKSLYMTSSGIKTVKYKHIS